MEEINNIFREKKAIVYARKINRIKFWGIKKNIVEYTKILKSNFTKEKLGKIVDDYFGKEDIQTDLNNMLAVPLTKEQLERVVKLLEDSFDKGGKRILDIHGNKLTVKKVLNKQALQVLISEQTKYYSNMTREVSKQINKILAQGFKEGQGIREMKKTLVENISDMTEKRAVRIARTELLNASNKGCIQGLKEADIKRYMILSARDNKVCQMCSEMDGKKFNVGDPQAPVPPFHPNGRCAVLAII